MIEIERLTTNGRRMRAGLIAIVIAIAGSPSVAQAQGGGADCTGPTGSQYCPTSDRLDPSATDPGGLPFTGLDLGLGLAAAAGLVGAGAVLSRAARRDVTD